MTTPPNQVDLLLEDDGWEPPPRQFPVRPLAASAIALLVVTVAFVSVRAVWTDQKARMAQDLEAVRPVAGEPVARESPWSPIPSAPLHTDSAWVPPRAARVTSLPGYLSINSTPWAELSLDGHVIGNTPQLKIRVSQGRHELVLTRDGFETQRTSVTVGSGRTVRITSITLKKSAP